ncbi:hypothetical protein CKO28_03045 [Rhodovibrio sodomensis]|uniref:IrrE N-terminal-like domain-containing protein n=1 Tax=Rhodovibrio sodomensis TaxID=1088 RepID=A0ABS1D9H5_9PROT|nr:hypothetical protein [Rhodovibrio sodomensis]MBK1667020.1 hypothetical protein [Rhodovibrio sodomensis]
MSATVTTLYEPFTPAGFDLATLQLYAQDISERANLPAPVDGSRLLRALGGQEQRVFAPMTAHPDVRVEGLDSFTVRIPDHHTGPRVTFGRLYGLSHYLLHYAWPRDPRFRPQSWEDPEKRMTWEACTLAFELLCPLHLLRQEIAAARWIDYRHLTRVFDISEAHLRGRIDALTRVDDTGTPSH